MNRKARQLCQSCSAYVLLKSLVFSDSWVHWNNFLQLSTNLRVQFSFSLKTPVYNTVQYSTVLRLMFSTWPEPAGLHSLPALGSWGSNFSSHHFLICHRQRKSSEPYKMVMQLNRENASQFTILSKQFKLPINFNSDHLLYSLLHMDLGINKISQ